MFEQLFGSKTRAKLIKLFLENPDRAFYVRELTRLTNSMINSIRRELKILEDLEIVYVEEDMIKKNIQDLNLPKGLNTKKFFKLNKKNVFHKELRSIFQKNEIVTEKNLVNCIEEIKGVFMVILLGKFVKDDSFSTDVLIVSDTSNAKVMEIIERLKEQIKQDVNYTIFNSEEYFLRYDIKDRFLRSMVNHPQKIVLYDKMKEVNRTRTS